MLNTSSTSKSYCRLGLCQSPVSNENTLREEYWKQMMLSIEKNEIHSTPSFTSPSLISTPSSLSPTKNQISKTRSITYSSGSLWLSSQYYIQKGFTATIHYQGKCIANTIEYLTRFPDILEHLLKESEKEYEEKRLEEKTNNNETKQKNPTTASPFHLGKDFQSPSIESSLTSTPEILIGGISCCVSTGSQHSRQSNVTNRIIGSNFPTISVSEALGVNLPNSVSVGVSYHGNNIFILFIL